MTTQIPTLGEPRGTRALAVGAGVFLISLTLMLVQIVLTRVFSVIVWYHFAFLAISVALLGLGAAGIAVHAMIDRLDPERTTVWLARSSLVLAVLVLLLPVLLLNTSPDWFGASGTATFFTTFTPKLLAVFALTTLPFFVGGLTISLVFARWPRAIHHNYAWDLAGAAVACGLVIPLLTHWGGPHALAATATLGASAAVAFAFAGPSEHRMRSVIGYASMTALTVALSLGLARADLLELRVAKGLDLSAAPAEFNRWNSFSLISVFPSWHFRGWGMSPSYTGEIAAQKSLVIDMNAFTTLTEFDGDLSQVQHTRFDLSALAFSIHAAPERSCIVGAGGGKDVLAALAAGSKHVTAVEINPLIVNDVMRERYSKFTGGLYERPDVSVHIEDGRSFMRRSKDHFDVVLISMVDTSAATAAGAYALAENSIYTVSAFRDFVSRLTPGGMLTVASVSLDGLAVGARLASLGRAALLELGRDPKSSIAVVRTPWLAVPNAVMYNLVIKPAGFSAAELASIDASVARLKFDTAYVPGRPAKPDEEAQWIHEILTNPSEEELRSKVVRWRLDVSPVDDDRPYFFYQNRLRDAPKALSSSGDPHLFGNGLALLLKVLIAALVMVALCIVVPLYLSSRGNSGVSRGASVDLAYVGCLGIGYMFIEIACIQRLLPYLGTPTHTLTAVLLVLLLAGGLGSRSAVHASPRAVGAAFVCLLGYAVVFASAWGFIAPATAAYSVATRAVIASIILAPLGFFMGIPLPSGLAAVNLREPRRVSWLWGVNGAASVLGSVMATLGSMHAGITALYALGVALYFGAALLWIRVSRAVA